MLENQLLDFSDLQTLEIPVKGPDGKDYILREASGAVATKFQNEQVSRAIWADGKVVGAKNPYDLQEMLVAGCLYEEDGKTTVHTKTLKEWPDRVVRKLFQKAKEISELDEGADTLKTLLFKVLDHEKSPCTREQLREHVDQFSDQFNMIKELFRPSPAESAKNGQPSTTDGLE